MPNKPTPKQLDADNRDLRARLEQAEATLSEILSGEADALFVTGAGGAQLFTLKGVDQSYRTLIENMSEGALNLTLQGLVLYANRRFAEMLRTPLEKVIGSEIHNWFAPESRHALPALLQKDGLQNHREELALTAADGTQVPVYLSVSHIALDENDSVCMVVTDLTQQKRNEAILAAEKLSSAILEQAADAIVICDKAGRIMRASKQARWFCGKSPLGQLFEQAIPLRHLDGTEFFPFGTIDKNRRSSAEARLERDGQKFNLLVSVGHLKGARDELLGSVVTLTDITERKTNELALQKSEKQLSEALTIARIGYWEYEYPTDEFVFNDQYYLLHKITAKEAGGYRMSSADFASRYVYPEDAPTVGHKIRLAFDSPDPDYFASAEVRILTGDGEIIWVEVRMRIQKDLQGNTIRLIGVNQDITNRKQVAQELLESQQRIDGIIWSAMDAIVTVDEEQKIVLANPAAEQMFGYKVEELQLQSLNLLLPERFRAEHAAQIAEFGKAGVTSRRMGGLRTITGLRKNGVVFPIEVSISKNFSNGRWFYSAILRDITERKRAEQELKESEARFRGFVEQSPVGGYIIQDGKLTYVNPSFADMFGYDSVDEIIGINPLAFVQENDRDRAEKELRLRFEGNVQEGESFEFTGLRKDGSTTEVGLHGNLVTLGGQPASIGLLQDISLRKKSEASIKYLNRVLSMLSGINTLIVRVQERDELFKEACNIAVDSGGFRMALLVIVDPSTKLPVSITSAGKNEGLLAEIKNVLSSSEDMQKTLIGRAIIDNKAVFSNDTQNDPGLLFGTQYTEAGVKSMTILPLIVSGEVLGALALYASEINFFQKDEMKLLNELAGDIAYAIDHINKQERLNYLAYYDALTGLANRTLFFERAAQYMRSADSGGHKLAIGLIDLERFKNINDSLGRQAGDSMLKQVAERLTQFARDANLLARIDADHFAFVVPEVKSDGNLAKLVENLMAAFLEHSFRLNDSMFRIGIKVGIVLFPDDGDDAESLFRNAEAALNKAKAIGDRFLFYKHEMNEAVAGKLAMENQLRLAIDNEEFVLHYQPKVNLVSGKVTSAEALIRWNDPRTGLVPPGMFIPILEETGLIYEVGRWALHKAMADYLRWRVAGLPAVRIAVNVSPLQLRNYNFIDEIRQVAALDAYATAGLELEITESLIMENVKHSTTSLQAIRAMGVTIAIDDFGTGFSSLSYLAKLPIDTLKIDRAFVIEMDKPEGIALVSTIIVLAHALKLKVVAEGVETEKQSRQLLSLNCDEMQGFLFSKPVPADIFEAKFLAPITAG